MRGKNGLAGNEYCPGNDPEPVSLDLPFDEPPGMSGAARGLLWTPPEKKKKTSGDASARASNILLTT